MRIEDLSLIADVGGTNARFALVEGSGLKVKDPLTLACANYPDLVAAITDYLQQISCDLPARASIAIATAVTQDRLVMTNHVWDFSVSDSRLRLGLSSLKVINDFTAQALALPVLQENDLVKVGGGNPLAHQPKAVLGPGTGLGVSGIFPVQDYWYPLQSEGGHVSYGPLNDREAAVIDILRKSYEHVSVETLVSGPGLSLLFNALSTLEGDADSRLHPSEIVAMVQKDSNALAVEALSLFCGILGTTAGNLALTLGAHGGVYIGGGVIPRVMDFFQQSSFRQRFEQHGRFTKYLANIPTYVINTAYPALLGAAVSLQPEYHWLGVTSEE